MKRLAFILALMLPSPALGAIALDLGTLNTSTASASTCNFSHAAASSGVTLVLVWVGLNADETISNATYGGNAMSLVTTSGSASAATDMKMHLYAYYDPPDGTQTVDIDYSTDDQHYCLAMTFTGTLTTSSAIKSSTGYDNSGSACNSAGAPISLTLSSTSNWMVTSSVWYGGDTDPFTPTNCADRQDGATGTSTTADMGYQQCDSTGNSGSRTHTIASSASDECGIVAVEITDVAPPSRRRVMQTGWLDTIRSWFAPREAWAAGISGGGLIGGGIHVAMRVAPTDWTPSIDMVQFFEENTGDVAQDSGAGGQDDFTDIGTATNDTYCPAADDGAGGAGCCMGRNSTYCNGQQLTACNAGAPE